MRTSTTAAAVTDRRPAKLKGRRPRLALLAWTFPPAATVGSVRTWNLAKHLSRLGWDVTVVTPDPELLRFRDNVEKTNDALRAEGIHRIPTGHRLRCLDPTLFNCWNRGLGWFLGGVSRRIVCRLGISRGIGWIRVAERDSLRQLKDVDVILASGPAFASFVLAERLSRKLKCPYVLDYRDPWWTEVLSMFRSLGFLIDRLEARLVRGSSAVVVVSPSWAHDLDLRFKLGSKLHVVTNGYDPEEFTDVKPQAFGHFAMVYTGIFYPPLRVVTPLLEALKVLAALNQSDGWFFHYYGEHHDHVREEVQRLGLSDHVQIHGKVRRAEALSALKGANVAVVITSASNQGTPEINGWIPAKLFEPIALGTPILLIGPPGGDAEAISEPTGLVRRFLPDDTEGIAAFIEKLMHGASFTGRSMESITWKSLANRFDQVLRAQLISKS